MSAICAAMDWLTGGKASSWLSAVSRFLNSASLTTHMSVSGTVPDARRASRSANCFAVSLADERSSFLPPLAAGWALAFALAAALSLPPSASLAESSTSGKGCARGSSSSGAEPSVGADRRLQEVT